MSTGRRVAFLLLAAGTCGTACGSFGADDPVVAGDAGSESGVNANADGSVAAVDGAEVDAGSDGGATVLLFVTSGLIDGSLAGLAGADDRCAGFAVQASLAGNYVALLATTTLDAFARLPEGRYVNTKGATLFSKKPTRASVLEGAILDENGTPTISVVWTGADATVLMGGACGDWLVKSGISGWTGRSDMATAWFKDKTMGCSTPASLYCVRTP